MSRCWVDGIEIDAVMADDRGLNYADGAFETLRCAQGRIECYALHRDRLAKALQVLRFAGAASIAEQIFEAVRGHLAGVKHSGPARLTVTRGSGPRGYCPPSNSNPRYVLSTATAAEAPDEPVRCGVSTVFWAEQPQLAGLKLLARTEQVLAAHEAMEKGWDDAMMLDSNGLVISSSRGNVFALCGNEFVTPSLCRCGIAGTRRQLLMERVLPELGFGVSERDISLQEMLSAEGVVISNAIRGIQPVLALNDRTYHLSALPIEAIKAALQEHVDACVD